MMSGRPIASAVRLGEHACCHLGRAEDRRRLTSAFVRDGVRRGHKVVYLADGPVATALVEELAALDPAVGAALRRGQLELRSAIATYVPDGHFDADRTLARLHAEGATARASGFPALSLTGETSWARPGVPGVEQLVEYERRIDAELPLDALALLCQYDHATCGAAVLAEVGAVHAVEVSADLAALSRAVGLAAARSDGGRTLRLVGELDLDAAEALRSVLHAHFHGPLRVDLADLSFADVAGMRALRSTKGQSLTIVNPSPPVRVLIGLLAWDTDPEITLVPA
jgi:anti-anti-sigma regulatory factor